MTFSVSIDTFDGPLDLLLKLIEKNEVDIFDIPIAHIAEQYITQIELIERGMDDLSGFLLMAATLLYIKSLMLLPRLQADNPDDAAPDDAEEPRAELVRKLLEYRKFRDASVVLIEMDSRRESEFYKDRDESIDWDALKKSGRALPDDNDGLTVDKLHELFLDLLMRQERRIDKVRAGFGAVTRDVYTVRDKVQYLFGLIKRSKTMRFSDISAACTDKRERITSFLALLELIKANKILAAQDSLFDDIYCSVVRAAD